jgi:hypothetical protein
MHKLFSVILCAGSVMVAQQAVAQTSTSTSADKPAVKAVKKAKPASKSVAAAKPAAPIIPAEDGDDDDIKTPDTTASTVTDYNCDHGQKITLFHNGGDANNIGMRWQTQLLSMRRVSTTTGADRFENKRYGLIWIGIPAKGMLLDSKKGQQLANECRSPQQALLQAK